MRCQSQSQSQSFKTKAEPEKKLYMESSHDEDLQIKTTADVSQQKDQSHVGKESNPAVNKHHIADDAEIDYVHEDVNSNSSPKKLPYNEHHVYICFISCVNHCGHEHCCLAQCILIS